MNKIKEIEEKRNLRFKQDPIYSKLPIPVPINIGCIKGGKWPSMVPDHIEIEGRLGVSPFETTENAKDEFEKEMYSLNENDEFFKQYPIKIEYFGAQWQPGSIDINHEGLTKLVKSFETIKGTSPIIEGSPWGTDGGVFSKNGIPSIVFGPGMTALAHQKDEYIEIDKIYECAEILAMTLIELCKIEN